MLNIWYSYANTFCGRSIYSEIPIYMGVISSIKLQNVNELRHTGNGKNTQSDSV